VILEALEPVDGGEREAEAGERDGGGGPFAARERPLDVAIGVLAKRIAPQDRGEPDPDAVIEHRPDGEEAQIEIAGFFEVEDVLTHRLVVARNQGVGIHPAPDQAGLVEP
jgi:hypothetical protein